MALAAAHLVCLTFDFDAVSPWIFRGETSPTALSRGEFGVVGARRLLALLRRRGIRATWFVPGHTIETYPDVCRSVHAAGHETVDGVEHERLFLFTHPESAPWVELSQRLVQEGFAALSGNA